jgi:hypothetical protein
MPVPSAHEFLQGFQVPVPAVSNPPTYASLQATRNALGSIASETPTPRGGGIHGYMGIVLPGPVYDLTAPGQPFLLPQNPGLLPVIPANATAAAISALDRLHKSQTKEWTEYTNLHAALKAKLAASVNPVYLQSIRNRRMGFSQVTLREMFQHLFDTYARLDAIEIHANRQRLNEPWDPANRLEDLISHFVDVQELATDAGQPIPDSHLTDAAFSNVFNSGLYDDECKTWEARPEAELTWTNFKAHFLEAQANLGRRRSRSTGNAGYSANSATEELEALVGQLVSNNENYMTTSRQDYASFAATTQQRSTDDYGKILQELQNMKTKIDALQNAPGKPSPRIYQKNDSYCWTHGFKVSKNHTSATCKNTAPGHQKEATKDNMLGGSTRKSEAG